MGHGYAGIDNELYSDPKTGMYFADAKKGLAELTAAVKMLCRLGNCRRLLRELRRRRARTGCGGKIADMTTSAFDASATPTSEPEPVTAPAFGLTVSR